MKIVPYDKKYKNEFIELNKQWITEMFAIEQHDVEVLENFERSLKKGGEIFFAVDENDTVLACCMISPLK